MASKKRARVKATTSKRSKKPAAVELTKSQKALVAKLAERDRELEELRKKLAEVEKKAEVDKAKRAAKKVAASKKVLEERAEEKIKRLEIKAQDEQRLVEREEAGLEQAKAIADALKGKKPKRTKKHDKPAIFRPDEPRPERPEIKYELPPEKRRRKPRVKVEGETIAERMQRADEMIAMLRDQKRKLREDLHKIENVSGNVKEKKALAEGAAEKIRGFFDNVKHELRLHNREASFRVVANKDATVDAEMRIPIALGTSLDEIRDLLIVIEETIGDGIPETQWISVGFTADPSVNQEGILRSAREYVAHEGQVRFNTSYQEAAQKMVGYSFLIGEKALTGFVDAYGPKITGILVRTAWSLSGRLFRLNDADLRKPRKKPQAPKGRPKTKR